MSKLYHMLSVLQIKPKTVFYSVFGQLHYFLIAIFLFRYDLVDKLEQPILFDIDFYKILFLSILFSLLWFLTTLGLTVVFLVSSQNKDNDKSNVYINALFCTIGYLSCALLLNYFLDYNFNHFIAFAYLFVSLRIVWVVFKRFFVKKEQL